ncbi:hypothetical protein V1522DRAFT_417503 [Lipomyces starkeyi]
MLLITSTLSIFTLILFFFEIMQSTAIDVGLHPGFSCSGYGVQKCKNLAELQCCYTSRNFRGAYFSNGVGIGDIGLSYKYDNPKYCGKQKARTTMTRTTCLKSGINWRGGAAWFNCFSCIGGGGNLTKWPREVTTARTMAILLYLHAKVLAAQSCTRMNICLHGYMDMTSRTTTRVITEV